MTNIHQANRGEASTVPVVSMDYTFMTAASCKHDKDLGMPIVVMAERNSDYTFADMIFETGGLVYAIKCMRKHVAWLGYKRLILKSDQ